MKRKHTLIITLWALVLSLAFNWRQASAGAQAGGGMDFGAPDHAIATVEAVYTVAGSKLGVGTDG
jgi:hypothetical protein